MSLTSNATTAISGSPTADNSMFLNSMMTEQVQAKTQEYDDKESEKIQDFFNFDSF